MYKAYIVSSIMVLGLFASAQYYGWSAFGGGGSADAQASGRSGLSVIRTVSHK